MNAPIITRAHGRVNLIGEHTDYNGGWVLPTTIPQFTQVTLTPNQSQTVRIQSSSDPKKKEERSFSYTLGQEKKAGSWIDYLQGITAILTLEKIPLSGFDLRIESTVPEGSGLSSSAALEMSFLKALKLAFDLKFTEAELARLGQRTENEFVGARVGIMDQMACALASSGEALFLDTKTLKFQRIPLPLEHMDLLVINSGISHRNVGGGYNERRAQCEEACRLLDIPELRSLNAQELSRLDSLPDVLKRRARHVVTENDRVFNTVKAIQSEDITTMGRLFVESHQSMRDDYEVSLPEIDQLVELCLKKEGVFGARLTGGGFGGSIVAITKKGKSLQVAAEVLPEYARLTGQKATVLV